MDRIKSRIKFPNVIRLIVDKEDIHDKALKFMFCWMDELNKILYPPLAISTIYLRP